MIDLATFGPLDTFDPDSKNDKRAAEACADHMLRTSFGREEFMFFATEGSHGVGVDWGDGWGAGFLSLTAFRDYVRCLQAEKWRFYVDGARQ